MRTGVRDTSRAAYHDLREFGRVGHQAQVILDHIQPGGNYSLQELVKLTGIPINAVSGRCNEMKALGALVEATPRKCSVSGRTVNPVALPVMQLGFFKNA